jgi:hypothetical protein
MDGFDYSDTTIAAPGSLIFVILLTNGKVLTSGEKSISDISGTDNKINITVHQSPF